MKATVMYGAGDVRVEKVPDPKLAQPIAYQITQKGEPFQGHDVSLNSLSDLIVKLALDPGRELRHSIGVSRV
jgi:hypothetical protein